MKSNASGRINIAELLNCVQFRFHLKFFIFLFQQTIGICSAWIRCSCILKKTNLSSRLKCQTVSNCQQQTVIIFLATKTAEITSPLDLAVKAFESNLHLYLKYRFSTTLNVFKCPPLNVIVQIIRLRRPIYTNYAVRRHTIQNNKIWKSKSPRRIVQ